MAIRHFFTKLTQWEFYPWWLANIPVYGFWLWLAVRARHLFFFSNVNPAIPLGGAVGESKSAILQLLPPEILPKTLFTDTEEPLSLLLARMREAGMDFPVVAKPDIGERGFLVKVVHTPEALLEHLNHWPVKFIIQEYLTLPMEASVLYHIEPGGAGFDITSVCVKDFLRVQGDGASTVRSLMEKDARAYFQLERFEKEFPDVLQQVPEAGEFRLLEPIGNHCRGTKFMDGMALVTPGMRAAFEPLCRRIEGVYYARFDLKCASPEALQRGEFKVMELNGVLGEPAHIYDPAFGMFKAYAVLWRHWKLLYTLSQKQKARGVNPTPLAEVRREIRAWWQYKKQVERIRP